MMKKYQKDKELSTIDYLIDVFISEFQEFNSYGSFKYSNKFNYSINYFHTQLN